MTLVTLVIQPPWSSWCVILAIIAMLPYSVFELRMGMFTVLARWLGAAGQCDCGHALVPGRVAV